jgi:hypothetical protein
MSNHTYQYVSDNGNSYNLILSTLDAAAQPTPATAALTKSEDYITRPKSGRGKGIRPRFVDLYLGAVTAPRKYKRLVILTAADFSTASTAATLTYNGAAWTVAGFKGEGYNSLA